MVNFPRPCKRLPGCTCRNGDFTVNAQDLVTKLVMLPILHRGGALNHFFPMKCFLVDRSTESMLGCFILQVYNPPGSATNMQSSNRCEFQMAHLVFLRWIHRLGSRKSTIRESNKGKALDIHQFADATLRHNLRSLGIRHGYFTKRSHRFIFASTGFKMFQRAKFSGGFPHV